VGEPESVIKMIVADSGPGIPMTDVERIFDPFFTTKEPGKGTGLGLAMVSRIVEGLGGAVWVRQSREGGAAFELLFPIRDAAQLPAATETQVREEVAARP
jgi:signal transduction histidine kinase